MYCIVFGIGFSPNMGNEGHFVLQVTKRASILSRRHSRLPMMEFRSCCVFMCIHFTLSRAIRLLGHHALRCVIGGIHDACTRAHKPRKWHTRCNEITMAYRMQNGLTLTWVSLSHTHTRGRWMKMRHLEMRAHGHANRGSGIRNAMRLKWHTECKMDLH